MINLRLMQLKLSGDSRRLETIYSSCSFLSPRMASRAERIIEKMIEHRASKRVSDYKKFYDLPNGYKNFIVMLLLLFIIVDLCT